MIMQPEFITNEIIQNSIREVKKKNNLESLDKLRLEKFKEGLAAQIMHIGPFSKEHDNILKLHELISLHSSCYCNTK